MRLLFVVQRYGTDVAGGAEAAGRSLATGLAGRGHQVEVLTSRARSYRDWADHYPAGTTELDGVAVHRLGVTRTRDLDRFEALSRRVVTGAQRGAPLVQRAWVAAQGPQLDDLAPWLRANAARFDAAVFLTYLYATTVDGLPAAAGRTATVLHPTAHDEPTFWLPLVEPVLRMADRLVFLTEEERVLVGGRLGRADPGPVIGLGVEPAPAPGSEEVAAFRRAHGLGEDPYLVCVGRVEPGKGQPELVEQFVALRRRQSERADAALRWRLVVVGDESVALARHPDVVVTGWLDDGPRRAAVAGAAAFVQPSYFESFSIVLLEAFDLGVPALVNGHNPVLAGHARRSGAAIAYRDFAELEAGVELLAADAELRGAMGTAGRRYVDAHYRWPALLDRYEAMLAEAAG